MTTDTRPIRELLESLDIQLPIEFLARIDVEEYLDELDKSVSLVTGERQRLSELLQAAEHITPRQLKMAHAAQHGGKPDFADVLIENGALTPHESDVVHEFQHRRTGMETISTRCALGNILVANRQITRRELEEALRRQIASGRRLGEELIHAGNATPAQISGGLSLQRKLVAIALALATALSPLSGLVQSAEAAQATGNMTVSVKVLAQAKLQVGYQVTQLKVTDADVSRGYAEVESASRFSISTDNQYGYSVEFRATGNLFDSAQVVGLGRTVRLGADGGTVFLRGTLSPNVAHELSYRFVLSPGTVPGTYPWPLLLTVSALPSPP
jgi:hypothetical protein